MVRHQTIDDGTIHFQTNQAIAGKIHGDTIARGKRCRTKTSTDNALVNRLTTEQGDVATVRCNQLALIDHIAAGTFKQVIPGKEICIRHVQRGRDEASRINPGTRSKQNARLVNQENLTAGINGTEDIGRVITHHPVQHHVAALLQEVDGVAGSDAEIVPVNNQIRGMLIDSQRIRVAEDVCITMGNILPSGEVYRIGTHAE